MSNENNTLNFPLQKLDWDAPMSDDQLLFQTHLTIVDYINGIHAGRNVMTDEFKTTIQTYNDIAAKHGYPMIEYPNVT